MPGICVRKRLFTLTSFILHSLFGVFERQYLEKRSNNGMMLFHFQVYHFKIHLFTTNKAFTGRVN